MGVKQRYIESIASFENDVLSLHEKLIPLQSSHTMSNKDTDNPTNSKTASKEAQEASENDNGRPSLNDANKKDSTVAKDASL